jgi:hypothetical protein
MDNLAKAQWTTRLLLRTRWQTRPRVQPTSLWPQMPSAQAKKAVSSPLARNGGAAADKKLILFVLDQVCLIACANAPLSGLPAGCSREEQVQAGLPGHGAG